MLGNITGQRYSANVNPASVGAGATGETNIPVAGLAAGLVGVAATPALEAGLIASVTTSAGNIVLRLANVTGGAIDPAAADWDFILFSPTGQDVNA